MGLGQFGLGAIAASLMGGSAGDSPSAIYDELVAITNNVAPLNQVSASGRVGTNSNITAATVGMVNAYINSNFNAYTSYVNRCYAEAEEEPIAELSGLAGELRSVTSILKIMERGTAEQKKKLQESNQLVKSLQEARMVLLHYYYPGAYDQVAAVGRYYFEPAKKEEAAGGASKVSASAADGFTETEFGKALGEEVKKESNKPGGFDYLPVAKALIAKGVTVSVKKAGELADELAKSDKFVECTDSKPEQLKDLPAGAVVVWCSDDTHPLGSCSIAVGEGQEASNVVRKQRDKFSSKYRLFLPL